MADDQPVGEQAAIQHPGGHAWRKRVAILVAVALAAASLILLERNHAATSSSAPKVARSAAISAAPVDPQVAQLIAITTQLRGAASLLTQTLPDLDAPSAAQTTDLASSASRAAGLSQRLASLATSRRADPAQANSTATQLQAALVATQAAAANRLPITLPIKFCNFTIQIGPIIINIPRLHIHIVIGPFFIHFRAPCFLSGIIPTHLPR